MLQRSSDVQQLSKHQLQHAHHTCCGHHSLLTTCAVINTSLVCLCLCLFVAPAQCSAASPMSSIPHYTIQGQDRVRNIFLGFVVFFLVVGIVNLAAGLDYAGSKLLW